jgi:ParB-like chromosome segregation protein Spo0J
MKKNKRAAGRQSKEAEPARIAEGLRPLVVPISELRQDPANARTHPVANLEALKGSLTVYGQRKPVVANQRSGVIEAGNGTLQAALALGWTELAVLWVDDDPASAAGYAIADNRTAELAGWDRAALDKLLREVQTGNDERLDAMMAELASAQGLYQEPGETGQGDAAAEANSEQFCVLIVCKTEQEQAALLERLSAEGLECRSLIS